jgi:hypothetical protein
MPYSSSLRMSSSSVRGDVGRWRPILSPPRPRRHGGGSLSPRHGTLSSVSSSSERGRRPRGKLRGSRGREAAWWRDDGAGAAVPDTRVVAARMAAILRRMPRSRRSRAATTFASSSCREVAALLSSLLLLMRSRWRRGGGCGDTAAARDDGGGGRLAAATTGIVGRLVSSPRSTVTVAANDSTCSMRSRSASVNISIQDDDLELRREAA